MPQQSKFGGIAVEDQIPASEPNRSKFGGVPVGDKHESVGGQKVLDFANETLSNVPASYRRLLSNMGTAIAHPVDTVANLGKVATGTIQNMTPGYVTENRPGYSAEANAAGAALKDRYGSLDALANTVKTDPVGAASDASLVLGGASGLARGASMAAKAANLPRVAGIASDVARGTALASDIANPLTVPGIAVGAMSKGLARPFGKVALRLPAKSESFGANPSKMLLEQTSGVRPATIARSAQDRTNVVRPQMEQLVSQATTPIDLAQPRQLVRNAEALASRQGNQLVHGQLQPMREALEGNRVTGVSYPPTIPATDALDLKRGFGDEFVDYGNPNVHTKVNAVGKSVYGDLNSQIHAAAPGSEEMDQIVHGLIPVSHAAQKTMLAPTLGQRILTRISRPTGGMLPAAIGYSAGGPFGAAAAITATEAAASPIPLMMAARGLYGTGKVLGSPLTRRSGIAIGGAGKLQNDVDQWRQR